MSLSFKLYITTPSESLQQIRRISLPPTTSWTSFLETLSSILPFSPFYVRYEDEEGDLVTINNQLEWTEALSLLSKDSPIRLQITPGSPGSLTSSSFSFVNAHSDSPPQSPNQKTPSTESDELSETVVIPSPVVEPTLQTENPEREYLAQSFQLLGMEEPTNTQSETPNPLKEGSAPESVTTQTETQPEVKIENMPQPLIESVQLPVGFSPSFLENVNFVPDIFSGRFWMDERFWRNDNTSNATTNESPSSSTSTSIQDASHPASTEEQKVPELIFPEVPAQETDIEIQTPVDQSVGNAELSMSNAELLKSIRLNPQWTKQVNDLLDMGFEFNAVIKAIQQVDGNFDRALEILLS